MISSGRRGAPLLAGLSAGAVLVASVVLLAPAGSLPTDAAFGVPLTTAPAAAAPTTARRATVPRPLPLPPTTAPPTTAPEATAKPEPTPDPTPEPEPTAEPATAAPRNGTGGAAAQVVELTNAERADAGCDPLDSDPRLAAAAQGHADDMAVQGYFDHVSLDGRRFDDRIAAQGHPSPGGENIARGQTTAAEVVEGWMNSPGHRRNILDCGFASIGVGHAADGDYWVQNFGR